jgi:D-alanine-D-alanine ligase
MDEFQRRPRIAVLFGGRSSEHAISCVTAAGILRAIDRDVYDVVPIGVTRTGRWVLAADDPARWELGAGALPEV